MLTEEPSERHDHLVELFQLRKEKEAAARTAAKRTRWVFASAEFVLDAKELRESFQAWIEAKSFRDPLPASETASVLAAITKRFIRVGFFGAFLAMVPALITGFFYFWQAFLMRDQNAAIRTQIQLQQEQIRLQQDQIERQSADTLVVRRAQLLATIYEEDCEDVAVDSGKVGANGASTKAVEAIEGAPHRTKRVCHPRAHRRARSEAVRAFLEIRVVSGDRGSFRPNDLLLTGADLSSLDLVAFDFRKAILFGANFDGASLGYADFRGAFLTNADFSRVEMRRANLEGASLAGVVFSDANLKRASLKGANLSSSLGLTQKQIDVALGDADTKLPPGLVRPDHWLAKPEADATSEADAELLPGNP